MRVVACKTRPEVLHKQAKVALDSFIIHFQFHKNENRS